VAEVANELLGHVEGMHLAVHLLLAHAASDQLGDLRAESRGSGFLMGHRARPQMTRAACRRPLIFRVLLNRRGSSALPW
jgi:hypothetical protein